MTPSEQNRAIAEWMGWTHLELIVNQIDKPFYCGRRPEDGIFQRVPNFHGDLNAIHEAEERLCRPAEDMFTDHLKQLTISAGWIEFDMIHADAKIRCEALLRTLGLWKEGE